MCLKFVNYNLFHSSSEYFLISDFLEGKLYAIHHLDIALSETLNFRPKERKLSCLINFLNSSLVGRLDRL